MNIFFSPDAADTGGVNPDSNKTESKRRFASCLYNGVLKSGNRKVEVLAMVVWDTEGGTIKRGKESIEIGPNLTIRIIDPKLEHLAYSSPIEEKFRTDVDGNQVSLHKENIANLINRDFNVRLGTRLASKDSKEIKEYRTLHWDLIEFESKNNKYRATVTGKHFVFSDENEEGLIKQVKGGWRTTKSAAKADMWAECASQAPGMHWACDLASQEVAVQCNLEVSDDWDDSEL